MSTDSVSFVFNPQWQSGAPKDSTYYGAHVLFRSIDQRFAQKCVKIDVETKHENDSRNLRVYKGVRQADALHLHFTEVWETLKKEQAKRVVTLGGDCGVELAPIAWLNSVHQADFAVIWFDAHPDMNTIKSSPSGRFDGMVLRHLIDGLDVRQKKSFPAIKPEQVILAGARTFDEPEQAFIAEAGLAAVSCKDLERRGAERLLDICRSRGYQKCYIHIDADVIDPTEFPCSTSKSKNGIRLQTLSNIVADLSNNNEVEVVGACLAEVTDDVEDHPSLKSSISAIFDRLCSAIADKEA